MLPGTSSLLISCILNLQICMGSLTMTVLFPNICDLNTIPCFSCLQEGNSVTSNKQANDLREALHLSAKNPDRSFSHSKLSPSKGKPKDPFGSWSFAFIPEPGVAFVQVRAILPGREERRMLLQGKCDTCVLRQQARRTGVPLPTEKHLVFITSGKGRSCRFLKPLALSADLITSA